MDLILLGARGLPGLPVVTQLLTAAGAGPRRVHRVPPRFVAAQIDAAASSRVAAVKLGWLGSPQVAAVVAARVRRRRLPELVVGPQIVTAWGDAPCKETVALMVRELLPAASAAVLSTRELALVVDQPVQSLTQQRAAAETLIRRGTAALFVLNPDTKEAPVYLFTEDRLREYPPWPRPFDRRVGMDWLATSVAAQLALGDTQADAMEYVGNGSEATHG
jgi:hydroxymethylpyrimidine/phosphomethylpyrimidine kinase